MGQTSNPDDGRAELVRRVADLEEQDALSLVRTRIEENVDPLTLVEDCQEGLRQVGERYERREYFLSALIMAGEIFREVMGLLTPIIEVRFSASEFGGSPAGDSGGGYPRYWQEQPGPAADMLWVHRSRSGGRRAGKRVLE